MKSKNLTLCGRILTAFLMIFCVTACSDDNEEDIKVVFPEKQNLTGKASDTEFLDLSFNANVDWTLTSSAAWCYFVPPQQGGVPKESAPDSKLRTISGNAGKQTVKIGISDEGQNFEKEDLATITIRMNGEEQVLAQVTRSTKERELKVYKKTTDADGEVSWVEMGKDEAIFAGYDKDSTYMVKANFTFAATSLPEWLEKKPITGNANEEVEFGIKANEDKPEYFKNSNEGTIVFQAQDNENVTFSRKVGYEGMDPNKIIIDTFFPQWNWEVSMDGQTFTSLAAPGEDSDPVSYEKFLDKWTLIARNDAYEMVYVEKTVQYSMPVFRTCPATDDDEVDWIHTEILEGNKVKITVDPAETEREGYVLAFPKAVYDEKIKKGDPWENLIEDNEVKYEYLENNLLLNFKQTKTSQPGEKEIKIVSIYWESYDKELELGGQSEIDAAIGDGFTEFLVGEYSVTANNVYSVKSSECNSVEIHVPFDVTSENQFDAYYMPNPPTLGKGLEKGSNGNIGLSEDADTKKVGLWNIQDTSDPIIVILKEDMEEGNYVNRYVIVVLPSKE